MEEKDSTHEILNNNNHLYFEINIFTRNCIRGELRLDNNNCQTCKKGKFSLEIKSKACRSCP